MSTDATRGTLQLSPAPAPEKGRKQKSEEKPLTLQETENAMKS